MKRDHSAPYTRFELNSAPMIVGAVLIGAGSLIGLSGLIVGGTAMLSATRQWLGELGVPPSEPAKGRLGQTKAGPLAGPSSSQQHDGVQRTNA